MVWLKIPLDVIAIVAQVSGALAWPILQLMNLSKSKEVMDYPWALPVGLLMASFGWWECFVDDESSVIPFIR
jgi:hypothetical protein